MSRLTSLSLTTWCNPHFSSEIASLSSYFWRTNNSDSQSLLLFQSFGPSLFRYTSSHTHSLNSPFASGEEAEIRQQQSWEEKAWPHLSGDGECCRWKITRKSHHLFPFSSCPVYSRWPELRKKVLDRYCLCVTSVRRPIPLGRFKTVLGNKLEFSLRPQRSSVKALIKTEAAGACLVVRW